MIEKFLEIVGDGQSQIVNIGAGYDTTSINIAEKCLTGLRFFEIDFPDLIKKKVDVLLKSREIRSVLNCEKTALDYQTNYGFNLGQLQLIGTDLHSSINLISSLSEAGVDPSLPTLVISECVLVCKSIHLMVHFILIVSKHPHNLDMDKTSTISLVRDVVSYFCGLAAGDAEGGTDFASSPEGNVAWVSYDMVNPNDAFGRMMR